MAFDPGFLGYRHDPSTGGIFFKKPDGGELLFGGEEAERMAADVDRLRASDPLPTPTGPVDPPGFRDWYAKAAKLKGNNPDPDDPEHFYDHRAFYEAMKRGDASDPSTPEGHFDSRFKLPGHPREFMRAADGRLFDTKTGTYLGTNQQVDERLYDGATELSPKEMAAVQRDMKRGGGLEYSGNATHELAGKLGRQPDRRIASYDPSAPFGSAASVPPSVPDVPGGMSAPPDTGPAMSAMPPQSAPPPPEPPAQQAPTDGGQPQQVQGQATYLNAAGYPVGPAGNPFAPAAMRPPQRKQFAATPGGYTPTDKTETVEGAKRYTPELIKGFESVHEAEQMAQLEGYKAQHAVHETQRLQAEAAIPELEREVLEAKQKKDIVDRDVAAARQNLDQLSQEASEAKVGGGSIWGDGSGKATAGGVMTLISAALTSMGSAILGRGPTGMDVINNAIERDIASQRAEVQRRGNKANNALAQYQRIFGDSQQAELALRAVQQKQVGNFAMKQAAATGDAQAKQKAMEMAIAADNAYLKHRQQLEENVQGKSILKTDQKFRQPTRGGTESDEAYAKRLDTWINQQRNAGKYDYDVRTGFAPEKKPEQIRQEGESIVNLPNGDVAHAPSPARAISAQKQITAGEQFKRYMAAQRVILEKSGDSITPEEVGRYDALVARNAFLSKQVETLGQITGGDERMIAPLTGVGGQDFLSVKAKTLASLKSGEQHVNYRIAEAASELFKTPGDFTKENRYQYGNRGGSDDPVNVDGSIARPTDEKPAEAEKEAPAPAATADESRYLSSVGGKR